MKKYCVYTRVSTEEQGRSGLGLEAQLDQCREYIARTHGQNIGEFRDIRSGKDRNRPGLRRAMELAAREGATLIVAKLDRLSRDAEYALYLRNTGVDLLAIDYPEATTITFCLAIGLAQTERELISGRTKSALGVRKKQLKEQGFFISKAGRRVTRLGNPRPQRGPMSPDQLARRMERIAENRVVDPRMVEAKKYALALQRKGWSLAEIADHFNEVEIERPRGGKWHKIAVKRVLEYNDAE